MPQSLQLPGTPTSSGPLAEEGGHTEGRCGSRSTSTTAGLCAQGRREGRVRAPQTANVRRMVGTLRGRAGQASVIARVHLPREQRALGL